MPFVVAPGRNPIVRAAFAGLAAEKKAAKRVDLPKEDVARSEPYRRLVASMSCRKCHKPGPNQAAHVPASGKAIKVDDRLTFALCADGPGRKGCHPQFDQYLFGDRAWTVRQGELWALETRAEIVAADEWPKKLPRWVEAKPVKNAKPPRAKGGKPTKAKS
jgi:hypothetical protein